MRFFNTEGPVRPDLHYCLPPLHRWDLAEVLTLVEQQKYFLLHAPRQTGKTSCLLALMAHLNAEGRYRAVYVNIEGAQSARERVDDGMAIICSALGRAARLYLGDTRPGDWCRGDGSRIPPGDRLAALLEDWASVDPQPLVLLLDEVDALLGDTLISLLRQLRAGYTQRPAAFPSTVVLCGVRDLRDYRIHASSESAPITGGSAFNIKAKLDLGLLRRGEGGGLVVANPIYREVLPRSLASGPQDSLPQISPTWLDPDGRLNPDRLLAAFIDFWRRHGEPLLGSAPYHGIAPHLVLMAFLQRVVNGNGTIEREYAIGRGRMDLCLRYGDFTLGIELKVWRDDAQDPLAEGLTQLDGYLAGLGLDTGWLVIFDRRQGIPPLAERLAEDAEISPGGRRVRVIRL